ncbi:MAG: DUF1501 domain-containing protein [Saprospiraceae bacterium]|nr:DUF1501 domain-containing protein [Saprospiraceae bacterium]
MKRRNFIQTAATGVVVPTLLQGIPMNAYSNNSILDALVNPTVDTDHVCVMIYLGGGNDGLNTLIPLDKYARLSAADARTKIMIPQNEILSLSGVPNTGLHPAMSGFKILFEEKKLNAIQSVGYPTPNFSHFRATDIWTSASDSNQVIDTGWVGRYLNQEYPGFPANYPNAQNPDPLAIQVGANLPLLFQGQNAQMSMNVSNTDIFGAWPQGINDPAPNNPFGKELSYIRTISRQSKSYADKLIAAFLKGNNLANYPTGNYLADTLKVIARVIKGGLKTRMYLVSLGGFDTHANQVVDGNKSQGTHATLLRNLSEAVLAFQRDLEMMSLDQRVLGMTFSEFGRRIKSNDSLGTDHGAAAPMFLFGSKVQSGVIGNSPQIPATLTENDNLPMQYDFRSVYASVLKDWFCISQQSTDQVLLRNFQNLPLIKNECSTVDIDDFNQKQNALQMSVYPNPVVHFAKINFQSSNAKTSICLFDSLGRLVKTIYEGRLSEGAKSISLENENYKSGNYYIRVQHGDVQQTELVQMITE